MVCAGSISGNIMENIKDYVVGAGNTNTIPNAYSAGLIFQTSNSTKTGFPPILNPPLHLDKDEHEIKIYQNLSES